MGRIHYAKIGKSDRLKRVLKLLQDKRSHSTREIIFGADVCAVNSCIAELRANGMNITCTQVSKSRFEYQLDEDGI